ncbi:MAG: nitronate monooxygenase family protein [Rhodospirillum sp.]|nr:nitronate monooxygenase family protein [Rhodospirillum sp.]MCF8490220.1 nitronate monooxygenase family protein [Rhodospirillum sp.]
MSLPANLVDRVAIPAISAPMFLTSGPDLVVEVCRSGLVGTFPALNQRSTKGYADWLDEIEERLVPFPDSAPFGVNLIVHPSNPRLDADVQVTCAHKVPLVITSLGAVSDLVTEIHGYGGLVFHDVINRRHAEKAAEAGVDGIIAVCAGAGGHAGTMSPFALVQEIRSIFTGTIVLAGSISTGAQIFAARAIGADMAYLGTRFLATREAMASEAYKRMILDSRAADIIYTPNISGVAANFLRPSLVAAGLDPASLPPKGEMDMSREAAVWKDLWSAGQGIGAIDDLPPAADLCATLIREYVEARRALTVDPPVG